MAKGKKQRRQITPAEEAFLHGVGLLRMDEMFVCANIRCRKRFESPSQQSVVLL